MRSSPSGRQLLEDRHAIVDNGFTVIELDGQSSFKFLIVFLYSR